MSSIVRCHDCGTEIDEPTNISNEARQPCTQCGSTKRDITIAVAPLRLTATLHAPTVSIEKVPPLLLQTTIVPGHMTSEGQLIEAVALPWFEIIELLTNDPSLAYRIDARKWEEIIAGAYRKAGMER